MFKNKTRQGNNFHFRDLIPKDPTSVVIYKFQCGSAVSPIMVNVLDTLTDISSLTKKQVKPKNSSVADHLLYCNHSASYDDFGILTCESRKFLLEL